jgi:hypothetical protein
MMSRLSSLHRRPRKPSAPNPAGPTRQPHSSWRLSGEERPTGDTLTAEDFWQKLGL